MWLRVLIYEYLQPHFSVSEKAKHTMSQITGTPTAAQIVAAARAAKTAKELERYSAFGLKHGGSDKLNTMLLTAKAVALVGAFVLTMILVNFFSIDGLPALTIVVIFVASTFGFDLVVCALYLKRHVFLKLLAYLALTVTAGAAVLAGFFYTMLHL